MQRREELLGKRHIGGDTEIVGAGRKTFHVLELHPSKAGELVCLVGKQGANRNVIVVGFLLAFDHDGIDTAVGVFVSLGTEIG